MSAAARALRFAKAVRGEVWNGIDYASDPVVAAVIAVADAEQRELQAEVERLTRSLAMREGMLRSGGSAIPCCSHCKHPVAELGHDAPCDICLMVRWAARRTARPGGE